MNTSQIRRLLNFNSRPGVFKTISVCACNELPVHLPYCERPAVFVVNSDPVQLPGTHWLVIFLPEVDWFFPHKAYFFDPLGLNPTCYNKIFQTFLNINSSRLASFDWNSKSLQPHYSYACGQFCTYFVLSLSRKGLNPQKVVSHMLNMSHDSVVKCVFEMCHSPSLKDAS